MNGRLSREELLNLGFQHLGEDVIISDTAKFYGASNMTIGNHVRIDDYSIFVGKIEIGSYVHIGAFASLHASSGSIKIHDFSGISSRVTIYAASDDFSGNYMMGYGVPNSFRHTISSNVIISSFCHVGTGSTLLPGAKMSEGSVIGAMSLVMIRTEPWFIYSGNPCEKKNKRSMREKEMSQQLIEKTGIEANYDIKSEVIDER